MSTKAPPIKGGKPPQRAGKETVLAGVGPNALLGLFWPPPMARHNTGQLPGPMGMAGSWGRVRLPVHGWDQTLVFFGVCSEFLRSLFGVCSDITVQTPDKYRTATGLDPCIWRGIAKEEHRQHWVIVDLIFNIDGGGNGRYQRWAFRKGGHLVIETVNDEPKNNLPDGSQVCQVEHSRYRSFTNFLANLGGCWPTVYCPKSLP